MRATVQLSADQTEFSDVTEMADELLGIHDSGSSELNSDWFGRNSIGYQLLLSKIETQTISIVVNGHWQTAKQNSI
jgi:hypothetical protein